jgi:hypothetical protein
MSIQLAFAEVCSEAQTPKAYYVSLYKTIPFYGGPEEGGWWGNDTVLEASQWFPTEEQATAALDAVKKLAVELSAKAKRQYGDDCNAQLREAELRGMDANDLYGEVDGESNYWVTMEQVSGQSVERGSRHWE